MAAREGVNMSDTANLPIVSEGFASFLSILNRWAGWNTDPDFLKLLMIQGFTWCCQNVQFNSVRGRLVMP